MRSFARWTRALSVASALAVSSAIAGAQSWTASLNGANEAPANASPGTGSFTFTLSGNVLTINGSFVGLLGTTAAAHLHCCTAASLTGTAGVATQLPTFAGFPLGVTSGTYTNSFDLSQASSWNASFITANGGTTTSAMAALIAGMNSGRVYFNIHTSQFAGGEIRGFLISTVPEPSSVFLTTAGLFGVALLVVRRRREAR